MQAFNRINGEWHGPVDDLLDYRRGDFVLRSPLMAL
jgi:hypothetical protein